MRPDEVIFLAANACSVYLICKCVQSLFDYKPNRLLQWIAGAGYYVIDSSLYLLFQSVWISLVCNLVCLFLFGLLLTKSIKKNLCVTSMVFVMRVSCVFLGGLLLSVSPYRQMAEWVHPIISFLLLIICKDLLEKIVNQENRQNEVGNLVLVIVPFCSIAVMLLLLYGKQSFQVDLLIFATALLCINFVNLWLYNLLVVAFQEKCAREMLEQKIQIYANQLKTIQESQKQVRQLRHDMRHHLGELRFLAEQNDIDSLKKYFIQMEQSVCNPKELVSSGNMELDSILNYMLDKAKQELREVKSRVRIPEKLERTFDISVILGNLLENAIDAAKESDRKLIDVDIRYDKGVLHIIIENSYHGKRLREGKFFITTKKEKGEHGIGLQSVQQIVGKYHGEFDIEAKELFCVRVVIYIPDSEG